MPRLDAGPRPARTRPALRAPRPLILDAPPGALQLPDAAAHLWLADATRQPRALERLARDVLDDGERRRAESLRRPSDRRCYLTAHVTLRVLLGAQLGIAAHRVRFRREPCPCCGGPHGRPAPADPELPLHFSLSHSGDLALLAFSSTPVGVDVQTTGPVAVADEVQGALHPREEEELASCPEVDRPEAFARAWVRKEAYLKGLGTGLARSPALDYLGSGVAPVTSPPGWRVEDVAVPGGYAGAVAVRCPTGR
ncbi:4'-phosphopantetheinyl transferase family protein [Streptomyces boluensis]|uniref:4'-phosphopantetheinyl transferase superfamily protein n=1 Tax=Streptomyces boluensis TaxID=1775135 RepID=A0A964XNK1_9ACTN|nr:4'-phosphopantetheinyl transferase superfamily protein [Streptomyces boluensis]NBE53872.1 4'-phosphopantetheinyl transferase superfamily protein [Streptomyces boluensis]